MSEPTNLSTVDTVLFDLDGTLVDTTELILSCHEHTLRLHSARALVPGRPALVRNLGRSLIETLRDYAEADGAPDTAEAVEQMLQTYRDYQAAHHDRLIRPFPEVAAMLAELEQRGYKLGVVTSKALRAARRALEMYGLQRYLPLGVYHDDTEKHKPDPAPLLEAARRAGRSPSAVLYVGDSIHDVAAARAAGMYSAAAAWGPFELSDLLLAGPTVLLDHPLGLLRLLPGAGAGHASCQPGEQDLEGRSAG